MKIKNLKLKINQKGFSLVEVLIFLLLVLAMTTILLSTAFSLYKTQGVNLDTVATKIASSEIDNLRNIAFTQIPSCPQPTGCPLADTSALSKLPQGQGVRFIPDNYLGDSKIRPVTIQITWIVNGNLEQINLDTLISEYGL